MDSDLIELETSDLDDEVKQLDSNEPQDCMFRPVNTDENCTLNHEQQPSTSPNPEKGKEGDYDTKLKRQSIMNGIKSIRDLVSVQELEQLPTHSLIQIQTELNLLMSNVVTAMQAKIPAPNSQEDS